MELVIQQPAIKQTPAFTVKVDTEAKIQKGDIICGHVKEFPNFQDKDAPPHIPAYWYLKEVKLDNLARLYSVVDKHYKVIEIIKHEGQSNK